MVDVAFFTEAPEVVPAIARIRRELSDRQYSDTLDAAGNQYVDLVMEGGGVLGIALVGYTYALEQAGIRFASIAGTSAGAINAMALAACAEPSAGRSSRVIQGLAGVDLWCFV